MTKIQTIVNSQVATMTSLQLLDLVNDTRAEFGESQVRHGDFAARCRDELDGEYYETFVVKNQHGPATEAIRMTADQCKLVAMRESKGVRRRVLARLNELEAKVAAPLQPPVALTRMDILKLAMESEEARIKAEAERDHAIATKAQISDRKTATAMATASAAKREVKRLEHELGYSQRHATILQVEKKLKRDFDFHPLRRWCNKNHVKPDTVPDKRYPDGVKAWPAAAWQDCYGVDLGALFAEVK